MSNEEIVWVKSAPSTNSLMAYLAPDSRHGFTVAAVSQTAGRGQRGNSWEAAPGRNLTFSVLLRPGALEATAQFCLSEAVSLAITDVLSHILAPYGKKARIKWPNDIYVDDLKICGILIENTLRGRIIERSIAGIGINVNQSSFISDAPNPTSLTLLAGGGTFDLDPLLRQIVALILENCEDISSREGRATLHARYMAALWRSDGLHPYRLPDGTEFQAAIDDVALTGHITLRDKDGMKRTFAFKEVAAVLPQ